ncbi:hypothetical protein U1Q18_039852 [Sarracenia purpurea var. burkii]
MHFAVPMAGAVLNAINTRLDAKTVATFLRHSEAKVFFVDHQYVPLARDALRLLVTGRQTSTSAESSMPLVVVIDDIDSPTGTRLGELEYEELVHDGDPTFVPAEIDDEWNPIALNYTSGTTSEPKGVIYSHRGAYLSTLSLILGWEMGTEPVYLWSLPMFHCNGWTFTWGVAARGGTNVCIRNTTAEEIYRSIYLHKVTHMCCAHIVFNILLEAKPHERREITSTVEILTGGAPPPAMLLEKIEQLGFHVVHAYGLTEATGPALVCEWQKKWNQLPRRQQAKLKARQGVGVLTLEDVDVKELKTMQSVPRDGKTMGEIVLRGSSIMKGYFKDETATAKAFNNGWYATGDVGVIHQDGYIEIKDSGGGGDAECKMGGEPLRLRDPEKEPRVWGARRCDGRGNHRSLPENLAGFMMPKKLVFVNELPKTATGKIQKSQLRDLAKTLVVKESDQPTEKSNKVKRDQPAWYTDEPHEQILALSRL